MSAVERRFTVSSRMFIIADIYTHSFKLCSSLYPIRVLAVFEWCNNLVARMMHGMIIMAAAVLA